MNLITISPVLTMLLLNCNNNASKENSSSDKPPKANIETSSIKEIKGLEIKPETFLVNAEKGSIINLETGSKIEIPDSAFVDESGNLITGNVKISWNEYHTLTDILLSGIPMKYDSSGVANDLVSGGMFKINANQNSKEVFLSPKKTVKIDIASINETPCLNFYKLDENKGNWEYKTTKEASPKKPEPIIEESSTKGFNIIEAPELNVGDFKELKGMTIIGWKTDMKISRKETNLLHNYSSTLNLTKASTTDKYNLELTFKNVKRNWEVSPYTLNDAISESSKAEKIFKKEEKSLLDFQKNALNNSIVRSIEIKGFGIFNWDCVSKIDNLRKLEANFKFPEKTETRFVSMFLISPDENRIIRINSAEQERIYFNRKKRNLIVAILPNNQVMVFKDFERIDRNKSDVQTLKMNSTDIYLTKGTDLEKYLENLI